MEGSESERRVVQNLGGHASLVLGIYTDFWSCFAQLRKERQCKLSIPFLAAPSFSASEAGLRCVRARPYSLLHSATESRRLQPNPGAGPKQTILAA